MKLSFFLFKSARKVLGTLQQRVDRCYTSLLFRGNGVVYSSFRTSGHPFVSVARTGKLVIGQHFAMNNGLQGNPIGCPQPCCLFVDSGCELIIGTNVGISQTALISHCSLIIGDFVKIGGGTCVYTTDFHSLNPEVRSTVNDMKQRKSAPVVIRDHAFIGAHCIILKGVTIGRNAIVGAGSVVTKSIPDNEIWAGNPAKFIRKV